MDKSHCGMAYRAYWQVVAEILMARIIMVTVLVVGALGFYLGWFHVGSDSGDGKTSITVTVDKDKIKEDERKARDKAQDLGHEVKDKAVKPTP